VDYRRSMEELPILTADPLISQYQVEVIW